LPEQAFTSRSSTSVAINDSHRSRTNDEHLDVADSVMLVRSSPPIVTAITIPITMTAGSLKAEAAERVRHRAVGRYVT
jgi:hypothetical protein